MVHGLGQLSAQPLMFEPTSFTLVADDDGLPMQLNNNVSLMPPMKPNIRVMLVLAAALVVAGVVFRQETEMYRLRAVIAELTGLPREGAVTSTVTNPPPADIEALRREAAEVHRLR